MLRCQDERIINLGELKGHIVKKIGVERSKRYFHYLSRFLSQKVSKREFDKSCLRMLGRENLSLHNHLIRSILRNASVSKSPPPTTVQDLAKPVQSRGDGGSLVPNHDNENGSVWSKSNGVLPISPRKVRSGMRDRKMRDSPLGSNGKVEPMLQQPLCRENGDLSGFDHQRYGDADERDSECKDQVAAVRDDDDDENLSVSHVVAPLGIPFCSASVGGGSRRTVPVSTVMSCCYDSGGLLPDTELLRKRMESIAVAHGLEGVSMECANTLNTILDVYLKKLIKSCTDLVHGDKQQSQNKVVNGVNGLQIQSPNVLYDGTQEDHHSVSLLDFRTAMELNPQQLGENWPILRERISLRSFEEQDF